MGKLSNKAIIVKLFFDCGAFSFRSSFCPKCARILLCTSKGFFLSARCPCMSEQFHILSPERGCCSGLVGGVRLGSGQLPAEQNEDSKTPARRRLHRNQTFLLPRAQLSILATVGMHV